MRAIPCSLKILSQKRNIERHGLAVSFTVADKVYQQSQGAPIGANASSSATSTGLGLGETMWSTEKRFADSVREKVEAMRKVGQVC